MRRNRLALDRIAFRPRILRDPALVQAFYNDRRRQLQGPDIVPNAAHQALARLAKEAGVGRFVYASTCSVYGAAGGDGLVTESAELDPLTPYAVSKVRVEAGLNELADDDFTPTSLRNATAFGFSPRLRADIVVNNLVGSAVLTGEVLVLSDGTPWRPLVHAEDIADAFRAVLEAPREVVHAERPATGLHVVGDLLGLAGLAQREDLLLRADGPRGGPAAGDEQVARVAGAHLDDVAGGTEAVDFLGQDELHCSLTPLLSDRRTSRAAERPRGRS